MLAIVGVFLGRGVWEGRLRPGKHTIELAAEGFLPEKRTITIDKNKQTVISVLLLRDPKSPFWRPPPLPPHFILDIGVGPGFAPTASGDISASCSDTCESSVGVGDLFTLRGGYELAPRLSFGLVLGQMTLKQNITGSEAELSVVGFADSTSGTLDHEMTLRTAFVGAFVGYSFDTRFPVRMRLSAGGAWGNATAARRGEFASKIEPGTAFVVGTLVEKHSAAFLFITPEIRVGLPLTRRVEISAGIELPIWFAVNQPKWSSAHAVNAGPDGYGSFGEEAFVDDVLVVIAPSIGARFDF
jgi:hypothetical protein